jgi:eukaryotic-like serine/threonine-protein kinase
MSSASAPQVCQSLALDPTWDGGRSAASLLASELRARWDQGEPPDARAALAEHPELGADTSLARDLAYEEYCRRLEAGEDLDPDTFCKRFPSLRASLRRLLEAHEFCEDNPDLWSAAPPRWPQPGELFGGFELKRELGQGAFARVFLATEPLLGGRAVAVKVSRWGTAEAELLGKLSHPNVVPVHSLSTDPGLGLTAICMPYLGAATLCDVLDRVAAGAEARAGASVLLEAARAPIPAGELSGEPPPPDPLLRSGTYADGVRHLAAQLADALAFVHGRGICHHDLKPSNVLLTPDARPMLLDFNLSRDATRTGAVPGGTLPYMSPEQLRATRPGQEEKTAPPGPASDVFSFGVLLYELLAGAHPFGPIPVGSAATPESREELRQQLLERQSAGPRPLREVSPAVDRSLARLVQACLACRPEDRPPAADLARALRAAPSRLSQAGRWIRRRPLAAAALLAGALAVCGAAAYAWSPWAPASDPDDCAGHLKLAWAAYAKHDYARARDHFTRAVHADGKCAAAFLGRARAFQHLGALDRQNFRHAVHDYEEAARLAPALRGKAKAGSGYCLNRLRDTRAAVGAYEEAIEAKYQTAELLNNLGHSYLELSDFTKAREQLTKALRLDTDLQAAYHNRALAFYREAISLWPQLFLDKSPEKQTQSKRDELAQRMDGHAGAGVQDIAQALSYPRKSRELYLDAANLYALKAWPDQGGRRDRDAVTQALRCLEAAKLGEQLKRFQGDPLFTPVCNTPGFEALLRAARDNPPAPGKPAPTVRVLDPIRDDPS